MQSLSRDKICLSNLSRRSKIRHVPVASFGFQEWEDGHSREQPRVKGNLERSIFEPNNALGNFVDYNYLS